MTACMTLTQREAGIVAAVFNRLYPPDDLDPGAVEIGAVTYLDRALGGWLRDEASPFRANLLRLIARTRGELRGSRGILTRLRYLLRQGQRLIRRGVALHLGDVTLDGHRFDVSLGLAQGHDQGQRREDQGDTYHQRPETQPPWTAAWRLGPPRGDGSGTTDHRGIQCGVVVSE